MAERESTSDMVKRLQRQADAAKQNAGKVLNQAAQNKGGDSPAAKIIEEVTTGAETMKTARKGYGEAKNFFGTLWNFTAGFRHVMKKVLGPIYRGYKWLWDKTKASNYVDTKGTKLSYIATKLKRGAAWTGRVILLGFTLSLSPDKYVGETARFWTTQPTYDAARLAVWGGFKTDTLYLNNSQLIDHEGGLHIVKGCTSPTGCDDKSSVFYRVEPRLMNSIWNLLHGKNPLFLPEQETAPIIAGNYSYEVTHYGAPRIRIARWLQSYPDAVHIRRLDAVPQTAPAFNKTAAQPKALTAPVTKAASKSFTKIATTDTNKKTIAYPVQKAAPAVQNTDTLGH